MNQRKSKVIVSAASRRSFLLHTGIFTASGVVAGAVGLKFSAQKGQAQEQVSSAKNKFTEKAYRIRIASAEANRQIPIASNPTNGDEERYPNKIGSDTRGLPHNKQGEVDLKAYDSLTKAVTTHDHDDFEKVILGGTRKLVNTQGPLAVSLEGCHGVQVAVPPPPTLASSERAVEAVELYWQALLRDVPFHKLQNNTDDPLVLAAVEELNQLSTFKGPKQNGRVTPQTLFRGSVTYVDQSDKSGRTAKHVTPPGILVGPYISQFALLNIPWGVQFIPPVIRTALPGNDFLTDYEEWLNVQNGGTPRAIKYDPVRRYISTIRDLSEFSHAPGAAFSGAALILGSSRKANDPLSSGIGAPFNSGNPFVKSKTQQGGNGSFALGHLEALVYLGRSRAIRAAYWQKFYVHRTLRPEAYGGLVHNNIVNKTKYPTHRDILNSQALARSFSKFGSYLLPHGYPEGAPIHSSYVGGAAAIAGVSATILKAYFDEDFVIPNPVVPDPNDPTKVIPYKGEPLTVGGELNKLAANYTLGRGHGGIHWRTDGSAGIALGEAIAISILKDERLGYNEKFNGFTFTKFDGTKVTV
ncbi:MULTISPECIES: vanadium-dependent haloperoxidase [Nostoc]|uniref:Vanadium-dependent haloperoxidase n=2 Tax=Nostoc TaxID=1177 RepID=A0ABR8IFP3_9NOSO|nr:MULTISPECIES: vanadium-dependent haloperoxidase [Nostoc]MBD2565188.1 vanadium-dependent haloperoxidase [Nostoc linckia FACHB-391]MBD2649578.1 vanadium-dependent haloperoxidase [Nostoc foliaceum FACHB-393]